MTYRDQATGMESAGVSFCVDGTLGAALAYKMGVKDVADALPSEKNWSWGIKTCIKDFSVGELRTLVIGSDVYGAINSGTRVEETVLLTGRGNARPDSTITSFVDKRVTDEVIQNLGPVRARSGNAIAAGILPNQAA